MRGMRLPKGLYIFDFPEMCIVRYSFSLPENPAISIEGHPTECYLLVCTTAAVDIMVA